MVKKSAASVKKFAKLCQIIEVILLSSLFSYKGALKMPKFAYISTAVVLITTQILLKAMKLVFH